MTAGDITQKNDGLFLPPLDLTRSAFEKTSPLFDFLLFLLSLFLSYNLFLSHATRFLFFFFFFLSNSVGIVQIKALLSVCTHLSAFIPTPLSHTHTFSLQWQLVHLHWVIWFQSLIMTEFLSDSSSWTVPPKTHSPSTSRHFANTRSTWLCAVVKKPTIPIA